MAYETIEIENHGAVRRILLARPAQRNAQSQQMLDELDAAFAKRSLNRTLDAQGLRTALSAHFDTHQLSHLSHGFTTAYERGLSAAIQKNK